LPHFYLCLGCTWWRCKCCEMESSGSHFGHWGSWQESETLGHNKRWGRGTEI